MKKLISLIVALTMCFSVCGVVFADEDDFVPSISYKDGPGLVTGEDESGRSTIAVIVDDQGETLGYVYEEDECLVVTTIAEALNDEETGIPDDAEELLEYVYAALLDGSMELPVENADDLTIIQLVDATFLCDGSTVDIDHDAMLEPQGVTMQLTFNLGVAADVDVTVMYYVDGEWIEVKSVVNNGDGTVTCGFEKLCPVVFAVPTSNVEKPPATGDDSAAELALWTALMAASSVALVGLVAFRRKIVR